MFTSVIIIIIAAALFGALHSILASHTVKAILEKWMGPWYRLFFNAVAGITFVLLMGSAALLPDKVLYVVPAPWRWGMVAIQGAALIAAGLTLLQTDVWRFLGLTQILRSGPLAAETLQIVGAYQWSRHPLYLFSLIILWFSPAMTLNQLTLYLVFSAYFYIGATFEENKLAREFGDIYRAYQKTVPKLIPWKPALWTMRANAAEFRAYLEEQAA